MRTWRTCSCDKLAGHNTCTIIPKIIMSQVANKRKRGQKKRKKKKKAQSQSFKRAHHIFFYDQLWSCDGLVKEL